MRRFSPITGAVTLSLFVALAIGSVPAAVAQDATPATAGTPAPLGAAECTVDPIDPATYGAAALAATPQPEDPTVPDVATGTPADEATTAAVTDAIVQSIACTNAGDLARLLAVIDPSRAVQLIGLPADQFQAALDAAVAAAPSAGATATPLIDDYDQSAIVSTLVGIDDIVVFPDGQAAATVRIDSPQTGPVTTIIYLHEVDARYLITVYVFLPPAATPAA